MTFALKQMSVGTDDDDDKAANAGIAGNALWLWPRLRLRQRLVASLITLRHE